MSTITINGKTFTGNNISIRNNRIIIDGKPLEETDAKTINIEIKGDVENLQVDACDKILITGNVGNAQSTSGDIRCGDVKGNVQTVSGDVQCKNVTGKITTVSGDINHG